MVECFWRRLEKSSFAQLIRGTSRPLIYNIHLPRSISRESAISAKVITYLPSTVTRHDPQLSGSTAGPDQQQSIAETS